MGSGANTWNQRIVSHRNLRLHVNVNQCKMNGVTFTMSRIRISDCVGCIDEYPYVLYKGFS